jgi:hypothetical protein
MRAAMRINTQTSNFTHIIQQSRTMNQHSSTIVVAHGDSSPPTITVGNNRPCHMILVGDPGSGKSTTFDTWAFRLHQAGAQVLLIGGARNEHSALLPILRRHRIASAAFSLNGTDVKVTNPFTIAEVPRRSDIPATNTLQRAHRVGVLLAQVTEQRMTLEQSCEQPLVVMIDDELSFEHCVGQLAAAYALWPALNMHLWIAVQFATRLLKSAAPAVRSLWLASSLQVYLRADVRRDSHALGLSDQEVQAIADAAPGHITIRSNSASLNGQQQSSFGIVLPTCSVEDAIIAARQHAYDLAA